ncbi:MAG TPA: FGLLP motif-containing membrane protein [Candidatus Limnocylindrales bacterium]
MNRIARRPSLPAHAVRIAALGSLLLVNLAFGVSAPVVRAASPLTMADFSSPPLAVGGSHACALPGDGTVVCWGADASGQLGDGRVRGSAFAAPGAVTPLVTVIAGAGSTAPLTGAVAIAAGFDHTCALLADTTVRCWGDNAVVVGGQLGPVPRSGGELGDGTTVNRSAPVTVVAGPGQTAPLTGVKALSAANGYTCALLQDGSARCWGDAPQAASLAPVTVMADATHPLRGIIGIGAGDRHACALLADGSVVCWGANEFGQLGDQGTEAKSAMPVKATSSGGQNVALFGVGAIAVGHNIDVNENGYSLGHSCALDRAGGIGGIAGEVWCWGTNDNGELGNGRVDSGGGAYGFADPVVAGPSSSAYLSGVLAIAAGSTFTCGLLTGGAVKCWGLGSGGPAVGAPVSVPNLTGVVAIAAGGEACAVLADGSVGCWTALSGPASVIPGVVVHAASANATPTLLPTPALTRPSPSPVPADLNGLVGDWSVTYGSPSVVTIIFGGGTYSIISKTPVQVTGAACSLPAGTLIAQFTKDGGSYIGQHGLWFITTCAFDKWADMTATLGAGGRTIVAKVAGLPGTTVFTRATTPSAVATAPEAVIGKWQAGRYAISFSGGTYSVTDTVETPIPGTTCHIPAGMVTETFAGVNGVYFGQEVGWNPDCSTFLTPATFTLHGDTLDVVILRSGFKEVWHRVGSAAAVPPSFRSSVPTPSQINLSPAVVVETLALAGGVIILVPFPGGLFNSTLRANYDEITRRVRRARRRVRDAVLRPMALLRGRHGAVPASLPLAQTSRGDEPAEVVEERRDFWWTPIGVGLFVFLTALLSGFLDPSFGLNEPSIATFVGMLIGLVIVLAAFDLPLAIFCRRQSIDFWLRALPATVAVSIACVLISRLTDFHPGYLYGLVIAIVAATKFDTRTEGKLMAAGALATIVVAVVAWVGLGVVSPLAAAAPDPGPLLIVGQTVLSMVVVAGVQVAAFGMLPLSFMAGEAVKEWNAPVWAALLVFGWIAFGIVILNPANGYLSDTTRTPLFTIVALLVLFSVGSVAFWYYFHRHPTIEKVTGA